MNYAQWSEQAGMVHFLYDAISDCQTFFSVAWHPNPQPYY